MPMCTASRRSWRHWRQRTVRRRLGTDISAACGQLRREDAQGNESCSATEQRKGTNPNEDCRDHGHRQLRQENQELQAVKSNVDSLLQIKQEEKKEQKQEKKQEQDR